VNFDLLPSFTPIEITYGRPQRAPRVVSGERLHRNQKASLVIFQARLEIRNERIAQIGAVREELADMRSPGQLTQALQAGCGVSRHLKFSLSRATYPDKRNIARLIRIARFFSVIPSVRFPTEPKADSNLGSDKRL
jgi:hypothetical protein